MYVCTCMYICMCICMHVRIYIYICGCMNIPMYLCVYVCSCSNSSYCSGRSVSTHNTISKINTKASFRCGRVKTASHLTTINTVVPSTGFDVLTTQLQVKFEQILSDVGVQNFMTLQMVIFN